MKNNFVYVAAIALITSGMIFAQTRVSSSPVSKLPASESTANQSGRLATVNPMYKLPGVVAMQDTPNTGNGRNGEIPGTGVHNGLRGSASPNSNSLPGIESGY
jgi:hypothetical protein